MTFFHIFIIIIVSKYKLLANNLNEVKKMSLDASKKILKVFGIITIIFSILGILVGIFAILGGSVIGIGTATGGVESNANLAAGVGIIVILGLIALIGSIIDLISGICSVRAANDISKIMPAWIFALIGLIFDVIGIISNFVQKRPEGYPLTAGNIIGLIIGLAISVLIFVAANNVKKVAGK